MITERLKRVRRVTEFVIGRGSDYVELIGLELSLYRTALVTSVIGYVALLFCALGTLGFVSVATIVSFWDTEHRQLTAWLVAGAWLLITLLSLAVATRNVPKSSPFAELGRQVRLDTAAVRSNDA